MRAARWVLLKCSQQRLHWLSNFLSAEGWGWVCDELLAGDPTVFQNAMWLALENEKRLLSTVDEIVISS